MQNRVLPLAICVPQITLSLQPPAESRALSPDSAVLTSYESSRSSARYYAHTFLVASGLSSWRNSARGRVLGTLPGLCRYRVFTKFQPATNRRSLRMSQIYFCHPERRIHSLSCLTIYSCHPEPALRRTGSAKDPSVFSFNTLVLYSLCFSSCSRNTFRSITSLCGFFASLRMTSTY